MPYGWSKERGAYKMGSEVTSEKEVSTPESATAAGGGTSVVKCTVEDCGRKFKLAAHIARHFNADHADLKEDKDSWREYVERVDQ